MENFKNYPLKLYIQDIFRAVRTSQNKYVYELFGVTFKNIMIHGVVSAVYNINPDKTTLNLELSDPTGTVQIYYDKSKHNLKVTDGTMKDLFRHFVDASRFGDDNIQIMNKLMTRVLNQKKHEISEGMFLSVVGDIFVDETRNVRMVSAYECRETCAERDVVWMQELRYLYDKFYLSNK